MKRKLLLLLAVPAMLLLSTASFGQKKAASRPERCGIMSHTQKLIAKDPSLEQRLKDAEGLIQKWIADHPRSANRTSTVPDTIPVVVHVVWNTSAENISDAQINSQIKIMNDDFARENADTINTPAIWKPISGGIPYRFVLARQDPDGNPTTGIVRVNTPNTSFTDDDVVKYTAQGGSDSWNTDLYLNIWVCDLGAFLLGYGEFPSGVVTPTRGMVCHYKYFGLSGAGSAPYNLGRTLTHEVGHCFNLIHIWGDDGGACTGNDQCTDTPNQSGENYTPPAFPHTDACSAASPGVMFMNYMDYTDDGGMNMFTLDQSTRMTAAIQTFYGNAINSIGIVPVVLAASDASLPATAAPAGTFCATSFSPVVTLKNNGATALTSVTFNYDVDGAGLQQYVWSGTLSSLATVDVTLPSVSTVVGSHTFNCYTTLPNGGVDPNTAGDTTSAAFTVYTSATAAIPYTEAFTGATFPPAGNIVVNPDGMATWERVTAGSHSAGGTMVIDNFNDDYTGEKDDFITASFDLTGLSNPTLNFWVAYMLYTDPTDIPNFSDTLEVFASPDCGATYTSIYKKFGSALATTTPVWDNAAFTPTAAQWRQESINLTPFSSSSELIFRFRNISQYENFLFIDDINVDALTGINENASSVNFSVYPNPSKDKIRVEANNLSSGNKSIVIYDLPGKVVYQQELKAGSMVSEELNLSFLSSGVYTLQLINGDQKLNQKIVLNR